MIELPKEPRKKPAPTIEGDTFLVIGAPKAGKSHLLESWPNCLVLDTQQGHKKNAGMPVDLLTMAKDMETAPINVLRQVLTQLRANCPYEAVAIDVLDDVSSWFEAMSVAHLNVMHKRSEGDPDNPPYQSVGDPGMGGGWTDHRMRVTKFVRAFIALPCTKIIVAHSRNLIDEKFASKSRIMDLPGRLANQLPGEADHVAVASHDPDLGYVLDFRGYEYRTKKGFVVEHSGSRLQELRGKVVGNTKDAIIEAVKEGPKSEVQGDPQ